MLASMLGPVLLITSRERLQLGGERVYPVPTLDERVATELFLARATALDPAFEPDGAVEDGRDAELRRRLGEERYRRLTSEGHALSDEAAIALALAQG